MSEDRMELLRRALWALPEESRLLLFLSRAEAMEVNEIAELLGCSKEIARQELRRVEEALSQALQASLSGKREVS